MPMWRWAPISRGRLMTRRCSRTSTSQIGRSLDFVIWYEDWACGNFDNGSRQYLATLRCLEHDPGHLLESVRRERPPGRSAERTASPGSLDGNFNGYIDSWIDGLKAYDKPVYIKFAHEMNGNWTPWGDGSQWQPTRGVHPGLALHARSVLPSRGHQRALDLEPEHRHERHSRPR